MIDNGYVALLQHDSMRMRHPSNSSKIITLYRIIATKTFDLAKFGKHVERYDIGGYVESLDNLDINSPVWIDNNSRVFDSAKVLNGSIIRNMALIYDNCEINNSAVSNHCRVHGKAKVIDSTISDMVEIKDTATVIKSQIRKSSKIFKNAHIERSFFNVAPTAHGNCQIYDSEINDITEIRGTAVIRNCKYSGRVIKEAGEYKDETIDDQPNLNIHEEVDESTHKEYKI